MNHNRDYYSIHCHSEYSNLKIIDSINRYERTVDYAWDLGLSGAAMTEHDTVSGAVKYIDVYEKKLEKEWRNLHPEAEELPSYKEISEELSFKPILGNEIYLTPEGMNKDNMDSSQFYHLILLAKDAEGFKQIRQISSEAWRRAWVRVILRTPTYPSDLFKYVKGGHLICSTACLGGYVAKTVAKIIQCEELGSNEDGLKLEDKELYINKLENHLQQMEELFGKGNFFIELQPNKTEEYGLQQIKFNKYMIDHYWGRYPFIFSTDAHYLNADEREVHKEFLNSKTSSDREVDEFYRYAYIMNENEVWELMSAAGVTREQFDEMANNTKKIMNMCEYYSLKQKQVITKVEYENYDKFENDIEIFNDVDEEKYPNFSYYLKSKDKTDHYFIMMIAHGFIKYYDKDWDIETYYNRLEEELWTIREVSEKVGQNMADYFISMAKMIDIMWNEAGSIVGPSRGSAGALLINYLFGITQMNPIKMNLPFVWRFLHPSRPELPKLYWAIKRMWTPLGGVLI